MTMPETQGAGMSGSAVESEPNAPGGAKGQMRQVKDQVVDQAKTTFRQARDRATGSLADSRRQYADQVGGIATALHSAGQHLRAEQQERIAGFADSFADQVDLAAGYLRDADLQRIGRDVERLARRQPALVFGAAFAIGLLGARFLKSSEGRAGDTGPAGEEDYGAYEAIRPGGQPAGLGGFDRPDALSVPRSTRGGRNAGA